jgi:hypothetical protein
LLVVGNGASSNLVRALKGQPPFDGLTNPASDYPRMPAGMGPVAPNDIAFIEIWINEGCLEDPWPPKGGVGAHVKALTVAPPSLVDQHTVFWREFDNRTSVPETTTVGKAVQDVMPAMSLWRRLAKGTATESQWVAAIQALGEPIQLLSKLQADTVKDFYGDPIRESELFDGFQRFGADTLPDDKLRPDDPRHRMNGSTMWFVWSAFADASLRLNFDAAFWPILMRAILIGSANDGLMRRRFKVAGFEPNASGQAALLGYFSDLQAASLQKELTRRYLESGL